MELLIIIVIGTVLGDMLVEIADRIEERANN